MTRPVVFLAWSVRTGRTSDLAPAFGAEAIWIGIRGRRRRWLAPLRYVSSSLATVAALARTRPRAVFVQAPPLPLTVLALAYGRIARVPVAIDAHTGAVLAKTSGRPRRGLCFAARFATVTIVTNSELADILGARVRTAILHDPIAPVDCAAAPVGSVALVAPLSWEVDEPFDVYVGAASLCADVRFIATGRPPDSVRSSALPENVVLTGYLDAARFEELLCSASAIVALTTREATMQRAGYEAMARGRPLIASDTAVLREFFADAALYASNAEELAAAVVRLRSDPESLAGAMRRRREEMQRAFDDSRAQIRSAMRLG